MIGKSFIVLMYEMIGCAKQLSLNAMKRENNTLSFIPKNPENLVINSK